MAKGATMEEGNIHTEAVPASVAVAMAMFEQTGIRAMVRSEWRRFDDSIRNLEGDMAVKALCSLMFDNRDKCPLYRVYLRCGRYPNDKLFGASVGYKQLSDTALGQRLDSIAKIDMPEFLWRSHSELTAHYGIETDVDRSGDASNYTVFGTMYVEEEDGTTPKMGGNAKDHSHRLQKNFYCLTDNNGILCYARPYDGNISDKQMNDDAIDFLARKSKETGEKYILTSDCKLCFNDLMGKLEGSELMYVTKVPANHDDLLRDRMLMRHIEHMTECEERKGLFLYETDYEYDGAERRLVLFRLQKRFEKVSHTADKKIAAIRESAKKVNRKRFSSEDEARDHLEKMVPTLFVPLVRLDAEVYFDENASTSSKPVWRIRVDAVSVDEGALRRRNEMASTSVLITNLPKEGDDAATSYDVVRHYLNQYLSEKNFRMMKSGMKVDDVFLHSTSRQDAMLFVVALATQMSNVIDVVLKREIPGRVLTCNGFCDTVVMSELVYNRERDSFKFNGMGLQLDEFRSVKEALGIEDRYLMGF